MKPSKEAIEAAWKASLTSSIGHTIIDLLEAAYAIDVAPLEARIIELENMSNAQYGRIKELEQQLAEKPSIGDCMFHRCKDHYQKKQINRNEFTGAECGACIEDYYEGILFAAIARLGGFIDRRPTDRTNFLQRIDDLKASLSRAVELLKQSAEPNWHYHLEDCEAFLKESKL